MKKFPQYFFFFFLGSLYSANLESTFLVFNHFDKFLPNADSSLIENFSNSTFEFQFFEKKLSNPGFIKKAPKKVVNEQKHKLENARKNLKLLS